MKKLLGLLLCGCIVGVLGLGTPGCGKKKDEKGTVKKTTEIKETETTKEGETIEKKETKTEEVKVDGKTVEKKVEKKEEKKEPAKKPEPPKVPEPPKSSRLDTHPVFVASARHISMQVARLH